VLDGTIGPGGQPTNSSGNFTIDSGLGSLSGGNLFFSFLYFNVGTGESANFTNSLGANIHNILARVTGGASTIDGTINVNIPGANFFLMNPAGITFTANAQISVPGSFAVTTADYLKFAQGKPFYAAPGPNDLSLSSAEVSAFGFQAAKPNAVMFIGDPNASQPSALSTKPGQNFIVVSGDQTIDAFSLKAPGGQLTLVSVAAPGDVPAVPAVLAATSLTLLPTLGNINIQDAATVTAQSDVPGAAGHVEIDAGTLSLQGSGGVDASSLATTGPAGIVPSTILIRTQTLLSDSGAIGAQNFGPGPGGIITIQAQTVSLTDGSEIQTSTSGQGNGGSINIAAGSVNMDGSIIETSTGGPGAAGNISVTANSLSINGAPSAAFGILAESGFAGTNGNTFTGRSGDINVSARQLALTNGGEISTTTFGPGAGGNVSVTASSINISGSSTDSDVVPVAIFQSGILASAQLPGVQGQGGPAGSVTVSTDTLNISNNGLITASTVGPGSSGDVTISASSIILDGTGATMPTGIAATTSYVTGGKAGNITLSAGSLQVTGGAEISAATAGIGSGGNISVSGGSVLVSGTGSAITAQTTGTQGGAGGDLKFSVSTLSVKGGGQISASTSGSGRGGSITINANQVTVDGSGSSIVAATFGNDATVTNSPQIKNVTLQVNLLSPDDSFVQASLFDPGDDNVFLLMNGVASGSNLIGTTFTDAGSTTIPGGVAPYTGMFQPEIPLNVFNTGVANGTWILKVGNVGFGQNTVTLESATLTVNGQQFTMDNLNKTIALHRFFNLNFNVSLPTTQTQVKAGSGGSVQINTGALTLTNGGTLTASTHGDGAAGSLNVQANSITIDASHATSATGLFASAEAGSTGRGGSILATTNLLQITGSSNSGIQGGIVARSATSAPAGDIMVQSGDVALNEAGVISSANQGNGAAGSVTVTSGSSITLQGGSLITVVAQSANAGTIKLAANQDVSLSGGSSVTAAAGAGGGSIVITAGGNFLLTDSSIVATAGLGAGGNITIDPQFIILNNGLISANAAAGAGGNIFIQGQYFFDSGSPITATGTTAGSVQISTLPLDLVNALAGLQGTFIDVSNSLQEVCPMRLGGETSSFLVIGRGGVEDSPDEPQEDSTARRKDKAKTKSH